MSRKQKQKEKGKIKDFEALYIAALKSKKQTERKLRDIERAHDLYPLVPKIIRLRNTGDPEKDSWEAIGRELKISPKVARLATEYGTINVRNRDAILKPRTKRARRSSAKIHERIENIIKKELGGVHVEERDYEQYVKTAVETSK